MPRSTRSTMKEETTYRSIHQCFSLYELYNRIFHLRPFSFKFYQDLSDKDCLKAVLNMIPFHVLVFTVILHLCRSESANVPALSNMEELVKSFGFSIENHEVETEDGYLLTMHRIPGEGKPVLLLPGLFAASDSFCLSNQSFVYGLNRAGFDIWLMNYRGTFYSRKHKTLQATDEAFWNFSLDEWASHDLPASIDYVLEKSKQPQLDVIAFSMGSGIFFLMSSAKPEVMPKIQTFIALAPVYSIDRYKFLVNKDSLLYTYSIQLIDSLKNSKKFEGFPRTETPFSNLQFNCTDLDKEKRSICNLVEEIFKSTFGDWVPAGLSLKVIEHSMDIVSNGILSKYDNGKDENQKLYNQDTPPEVKLDKITMPTHFIFSTGDEIIDEDDIEHDEKSLVSLPSVYEIDNEEFLHADFMFPSKPNVTEDYTKMVNYIQEALKK